jgi:hypothetical protein
MRNSIDGIYKALRHFGVSAEEVDKIAENYKMWKTLSLTEGFGFVYVINGTLCSIPIYPDEKTKKEFIGFEIGGTFYLNRFATATSNNIANSLSQLKLDCNIPNEIELELPTLRELLTLQHYSNRQLFLYTESSLIEDRWIKPEPEYPKYSLAISICAVFEAFKPVKKQSALVHPVIHKSSHTFIGRMNHYGVPDKRTMKKYQQLLANINH